MSDTRHRTPHSLVPLFPQFLRKRRRGCPGIATLLAETGIPRPVLFLLFSLAVFPPEGATEEELRPGAPYATRDPHLPSRRTPWSAASSRATSKNAIA
ncbi:MAG: hypothetical protein U0232_18710 [Thermomicrobiales bacterium]